MYPNPFPKAGSGDVQIFNQPSTTDSQWHTWNKPKGCTLVYILCIGGGGGGASGGGGSVGGGGGGSSSTTRCLIPASLLPDVLFVKVGAGGAGGVASNGGSGGASYVAVSPAATITASNIIAQAASGAGGVIDGGGGNGGAARNASDMPLCGMGRFQSVVGQNGTARATTTGVAQTLPTTGIICMGGLGGGTYNVTPAVGAEITAVTDSYLSEARPVRSQAGGTGISSGYRPAGVFFSYPGLSSGTRGTGDAAINGGSGYCGSGGGGSNGSNSTTGDGGVGGSGLILIISA